MLNLDEKPPKDICATLMKHEYSGTFLQKLVLADPYSAIHTDLTTLQCYPKAATPLECDLRVAQRFKRLGIANKPLQQACKLFKCISKSIRTDHKKEC